MAERILAVFDSADEALAAVSTLRGRDVPRSAITVMSAEPIHAEARESEKESKSRIGLFAIAGGVTGAALAVTLTVWTSQSVNLVTGGMPVVSPWPFGIITFEITALGAILFTLARMIYEARLARHFALADYDQAVADGKIVLSVYCEDDVTRESVKEILSAAASNKS